MQLKQLELAGGGTLTVYLRDCCERMPNVLDRPLVLVVPGGGYTHVSAREGDPVALQFAAAGYHTAVLDYAICEKAKDYMPLRQLAEAIGLVRQHAAQWHILPEKIAVCGFSAGGHLALSGAVLDIPGEAAQPRPGAEITLEANPETVTEETLRGFRAAGVNRVSFGVQSARDSQLKTLGRPHTAKQARAAFAAAQRAGFTNISGDIMLALPHYTQAEFDETLELIENGGATHVSAYLLKIEPDSAFGRKPPEGLPTSDEAADFYLYAVEQLEHHGYQQYEISNFARPGYEGKHNLIYWDCGDYLGIGPAAHSCMGGKRFYYPADTEAFLRDEAAPVMDGGCGAEDYLILQLRLRKGLSLDEYKKRYGREFSTAQLAFVQNCVKSGYANFDGHTLALTPAGLIVQNSILAELL